MLAKALAIVAAAAVPVSGFVADGPIDLPLSRSYDAPALAKRGDANLTVIESYPATSSRYYIGIEVGTPPRPFNVTLSMEFSQLILFGEDAKVGLDGPQCLRIGPCQYLGNQSSSYHPVPSVNATDEGFEKVITQVVEESVVLAGTQLNTTFVSILDSVNETEDTYFSMNNRAGSNGFLGLAASVDPGAPATAFLSQLAKTWAQPIVGLFVERTMTQTFPDNGWFDARKDEEGVMTFGGTNSAYYSGNISYIPSDKFFRFGIDAIAVDGANITLVPAKFINGSTMESAGLPRARSVLNPASGYLTFPPKVVQDIYERIPGSYKYGKESREWAVPCNTTTTVSVTIAGRKWDIKPFHLLGGAYIRGRPDFCTATITSLQDMDMYLLGLPFMRNVYTAFKYDPLELGFAPLAASVNTLTPASKTIIPDSSTGIAWDVPSQTGSGAPTATGNTTANQTDNTAANSTTTTKDSGGGQVAVPRGLLSSALAILWLATCTL